MQPCGLLLLLRHGHAVGCRASSHGCSSADAAALGRAILLLTVALASLIPAALIVCIAAVCMQERRRRLARKAAELGRKCTP